jgi:hypothetical protein
MHFLLDILSASLYLDFEKREKRAQADAGD